MYTIALDAMGGDNAPQAVVEGAKLAVKEFSTSPCSSTARKRS